MQTSDIQGVYSHLQLWTVPWVEYRSSRIDNNSRETNQWYFSSNGCRGVNLATALSGDFETLDGRNDKFFENTYKAKVRYCIAIEGFDRVFQQKNIFHVKRGKRVVFTREKLVAQITEVAASFIDNAARAVSQNASVCFGPGYIEMRNLYLVELRQIGSTLQPIFAYSGQHLSERIFRAQEAPIARDDQAHGTGLSGSFEEHCCGPERGGVERCPVCERRADATPFVNVGGVSQLMENVPSAPWHDPYF